MAAVDEWIAREYFEALGFLTAQPIKYAGTSRERHPEEGISLIVSRPSASAHTPPQSGVWRTADMAGVSRAVVSVRGGHTDPVYPSTFENTPEIIRLSRAAAMRTVTATLGTSEFSKILCLPRLPSTGTTRERCIAAILGHGVDGIIEFETLLGELVHRADTRKHYEKSDLLQILRLLKVYAMITTDQLELFSPLRHRRGQRSSG